MPHKDPVARREYMRKYQREYFHRRCACDPVFVEQHRARERARYYVMKNDPEWMAQQRIRKNADPKKSARAKEWHQRQRLLNPEGYRKKCQANQTRWVRENPEKARMKWLRDRLRRRGMRRLSAAAVQWIIDQWKWRCAWCGGRGDKFELDHIVAVTVGGASAPSNLVLACRSCNVRKSNRPWVAWFRAQAFYSAYRERRIRAWLRTPDVLDAMPGRVIVRANDYGSRMEVV